MTKLKLDKEVGGGGSLHWKSVLPLVFCVVESLTTRLRQTMSCHRIGLSYSTRLWTPENTASRCVTVPALDTGTVHFYPSVPTDPDYAFRPPESKLNGRITILDDRSFGHTNTCVIAVVRRERHPCSQSLWKKMLQRLLKPRQS